MSFRTKEDAVHFAEKQGDGIFSYSLYSLLTPVLCRLGLLCVSHAVMRQCSCSNGFDRQQETVKRIPPKNYSENYLYNPNKLRIMKTK